MEFPPNLHPEFRHLLQDTNCNSTIIHAKMHLQQKAPTYHLCKSFAEALWEIPDKTLPLNLIPDGFFCYMSFPTGLLRDHVPQPLSDIIGEPIAGAYVWVGRVDHTTPFAPYMYGERVCWISYQGEMDDAIKDRRYPGLGRLVFSPTEGLTIREMFDKIESKDFFNLASGREKIQTAPEEEKFRIRLASLILNAALYINSDDPDILDLTPTFNGTRKHIEKNTSPQGHLNACTIPIRAVSWDFKRSEKFSDEDTLVHTHPRWQRCGPNFSQVKLIWVAEHTRTYRKLVDPASQTASE
jgi:hypothetical protein